MSDVERIVNTNAERVQWAREIALKEIAPPVKTPEKKRRGNRRQAARSGALVCAMFVGSGVALLGLGLASNNLLTVAFGILIAGVFGVTGLVLDTMEG